MQMAPDGKNAWVYHRYEGTADLYNLESGRITRTGPQSRELSGAWVDDKSYLAVLAEQKSRLVRFGIDGEMTPVEHENVESGIVKAVFKAGRLYVLSGERELTVTETGGGGARAWTRSGVSDFALSPDGRQIALVCGTGPDQSALVLADAVRGGSEKTAARGRLLGQLSWSPDGSRVAFSVFSPDQGMTGLYVMNADSGRMIPVSYKPNLKSVIDWSPAGTSFMVSEVLSGDITDNMFTTIYQLK
ncbi:TolB family protein [Paenibacillus chitinolyticus]|uniref:TolB family protein n=1 Tax=Paenibacillus chitinolyticus TaxID=79263 RepID=UPI0036412B25